MLDVSFLFDEHLVPFTVAIMVMFGIGLLELVGIGVSAIDLDIPDAHVDVHADVDGDFDLLGFLGIGRVPLMVTLVSALTLFGLTGMIVQNTLLEVVGHPLPLIVAVPLALFVTVVLLGVTSKILARIMPRDETTAVGLDELLWRKGYVTLGEARLGHPTRARVADIHGTVHHVMVEPEFDTVLSEGDEILLKRREGDIFYASNLTSPFEPIN